jgi:hypothetical protein
MVTFTFTFTIFLWEVVVDPKGPAEHTLGTTDLVERIKVVFFLQDLWNNACAMWRRCFRTEHKKKTVKNVSGNVWAIQHTGDKLDDRPVYSLLVLCILIMSELFSGSMHDVFKLMQRSDSARSPQNCTAVTRRAAKHAGQHKAHHTCTITNTVH